MVGIRKSKREESLQKKRREGLQAHQQFATPIQTSTVEKKIEATEACETSVEEWKQLEESILSSVVHIHNKLFGSADLVQLDSYASEMAKMVEALAPLQQRISSLDELQDHNDVQKISYIIDMLLSLPSVTPLAKTFSGMQFLLHKAQAMQESGLKFCFSRELEPVFQLLSSWKTLELESWPGLLDEVMDQYESNAGKLWFPLCSVLQPSSFDQSVVQCLEDFIHTSIIGEYRKRL